MINNNDDFYKNILQNAPVGYAYHKIVYDKKGIPIDYVFIEINNEFERQTGLKREEVVGKTLLQILPDTKKDKFDWISKYGEVASGGKRLKFRQYSKALHSWYDVDAYSPKKDYFVTYFYDVTDEVEMLNESKDLVESLNKSVDRKNIVEKVAHIGCWEVNIKTGETYWSDELYRICGYKPQSFIPSLKLGLSFIHADDRENVYLSIKKSISAISTYQIENRIVREDGEVIWVFSSGNVQCDEHGKAEKLVGFFWDITDRKKQEEEIKYISFHDELTGLYNRNYFQHELKRLNTKRQFPLSIIIGDVNGLKLTNDVFGHLEGDKLLKTIAEILKKSCRTEDIISRWGGDEFIILLPKTTEEIAAKRCDEIKTQCLKWNDIIIKPSISLGYKTKYNIEESLYDIIKDAEYFMYKKKQEEGRNIRNELINNVKSNLYLINDESSEQRELVLAHMENFARTLNLSEDDIDKAKLLAELHNIGKITINKTILNKPGPLNSGEGKEIKKHPEIGYRVATSIPILSKIADYILYHHERWDGKGYPAKLKEKEIPFMSRMMVIVEAYNAMISQKPYRKALSKEEAVKELLDNAGSQFDPELVPVFVEKVLKWY